MKSFDTESSDFTTGIFSVEELINSYELFMNFKKAISDNITLRRTFEFLQEKENEFLINYYNYYRYHIFEQLYDTNLHRQNYDLDLIATMHTEFMKLKSSILAYYILVLQDKPLDSLKIVNFEAVIEHLKDRVKGVVLTFYHWGLFQLLPITLLNILKKPIVLFAADEALSYQNKIIQTYYPDLSKNFIGLPTSISSLKKAIQLAKEGCVICILPELSGLTYNGKQFYGKKFLGNKVRKPNGAAFISSRASVPLLRAITEEDSNCHYRLIVKFKLIKEKVGLSNNDIEKATEIMWSDLEDLCLEKPHLWNGWEIFNRIKERENWLSI